MTARETDNLALVRRYLIAVASGTTGAALAAFYAPDAVQEEFPNRLMATGARRDRLDPFETVPRVEGDRIQLGIDHDARAAGLVRHLGREPQDEPQELGTQPPPLRGRVDGKSRQPKHGKRVARELLSHALGKVVDLQLPRCHRGKANDTGPIGDDAGDAEIASELALARIPTKEAIERFVAGLESGAVVVGTERPNLHRASVD
jgi:hypothetical protein